MSLDALKNVLTMPGMGVHTVHTASDLKLELFKKYYAEEEEQNVRRKWEKSLTNLYEKESAKFALFGVCSDAGGGIQRGANWGPLFLRNELIDKGIHQDFEDIGDIRVIPHLLHDKYLNLETIKNCQRALFKEERDLPVSPLSMAKFVLDLWWEKNPHQKFLSLGGDHSVSYPLVKAWLEKNKKRGIKSAVIHFDAHTDLLANRLGIDFCFASWAYHILEDLADPSLLIQLGIRSSGKSEEYWESTLGVQQYWSEEVKNRPLNEIAEEILTHLEKYQIEELYISCDIDALDQEYAAATGTPEPGGLGPHHVVTLTRLLGDKIKITSGDLVEVAPFVKARHTDQNLEPKNTLLNSGLIIEAITHGQI